MKDPPEGGSFIFASKQGSRTGAVVNDVPGARQSRDPACAAAQVNSPRLHHVGADFALLKNSRFCGNGCFFVCALSLLLSKSDPLSLDSDLVRQRGFRRIYKTRQKAGLSFLHRSIESVSSPHFSYTFLKF